MVCFWKEKTTLLLIAIMGKHKGYHQAKVSHENNRMQSNCNSASSHCFQWDFVATNLARFCTRITKVCFF